MMTVNEQVLFLKNYMKTFRYVQLFFLDYKTVVVDQVKLKKSQLQRPPKDKQDPYLTQVLFVWIKFTKRQN